MSTKLVKQEQLDKVKNRIQSIYTSKSALRISVWLNNGSDKESVFVYGQDNNTFFAFFISFNVVDKKVYANLINIVGNHSLSYADIENDHIILDVLFSQYSRINAICASGFSLWEFNL